MVLDSEVVLQVSRVSGSCYDCMCRLTEHSFCSAGGRLVTAARAAQARHTICAFNCLCSHVVCEHSEGRCSEGLSVTLLVWQVAAVAGEEEEDPLCEMCTQFVTDLKTYISSDQGRAYFTNMINQVNMYGY